MNLLLQGHLHTAWPWPRALDAASTAAHISFYSVLSLFLFFLFFTSSPLVGGGWVRSWELKRGLLEVNFASCWYKTSEVYVITKVCVKQNT